MPGFLLLDVGLEYDPAGGAQPERFFLWRENDEGRLRRVGAPDPSFLALGRDVRPVPAAVAHAQFAGPHDLGDVRNVLPQIVLAQPAVRVDDGDSLVAVLLAQPAGVAGGHQFVAHPHHGVSVSLNAMTLPLRLARAWACRKTSCHHSIGRTVTCIFVPSGSFFFAGRQQTDAHTIFSA